MPIKDLGPENSRIVTPELWAVVTELFGQALDLPLEERRAFVSEVSTSNAAAARELECLLEEHERPGEFLSPIQSSASPVTDLTGTTVGAYRLVRVLGGGGMGTVYLAERSDGAFSKQVALKLMSPAFLDAQDRFQQEREFLARLDHPNIARLLDGGSTSQGLPYLVLEYVDGIPITHYCADRRLKLEDRLRLLLQVCAGIAHAHQRLVIHRDIKPENILVTADGIVKLLDFGIATLRDSVRVTEHRPATPAYSSPEQLSGGAMTTASDVYVIGVLAYEVLTGSLPYQLRSNNLGEILNAVITAEPVPASQAAALAPHVARQLGGDLDNILARAIAKDPNRRYASAQQLAEDIEAYLAGLPVRARPDTIGYRARKFVGRHTVASALATLTIVFLVAGITVSTWQASVARRRFDDLRELAHAVVFDVNDTLAAIPGTTAARKLVVETALHYLDRLGRDDVSDPQLREEIAAAYLRIGKVQGGAFLANLGDSAGALESFRKAIATVDQHDTTVGLRRVAIEAHINIATLATDPIQSLPDFDAAIQAAEQQLIADPNDVETLRLIAEASHGRATIGHVTDRVADEELMSRREIEFRKRALALAPEWRYEVALTQAMAQHALALLQAADYAGAYAELGRASAILEVLLERHPGNQVITRELAEKRSRSGPALLAMGKAEESAAIIESAIALLQPLVRADASNAGYRGDLAYAWYRLADALRAQGQTSRALALHQQALAFRRERVARDPTLTFIRWDLSQSLNAVGELLLTTSPLRATDAAALFREARELADATLKSAPSFNELRKQVARADEGLGRAAMLRADGDGEARAHFERSLQTWQEFESRSNEDKRDAAASPRVQVLLSSLEAR
jgi:eukaryotic-like serine/threonine-protein kinase